MSASIGDLRKRVKIQRRSVAQDASFGAQVADWTDITTVWVAIEGLNMREQMSAAAFSTEVQFKLTMRYQPFLADPKDVASYRGIYNGRILCFHGAINVDERNRHTVIYASEGLNDG